MANQWLRLWHDMPNDPKWRTIARISGQPIALVQAVYVHLLVSGSQNVTRGHADVTNEDLASHFDVTECDIDAVINAMQGRVLDGTYLTGWERRQPKKEDRGNDETGAKSATQRKREQRERQRMRQQESNESRQCHGKSRNVTTDKEEIKRREDIKDKPHTGGEQNPPVDNSAGGGEPDPDANNAMLNGYVAPGGMGEFGKFQMHDNWKPDPQFTRRASQWGINLKAEITPFELAEFITYWKAEGKAFHHDQWQQKLARSVQQSRARPVAQQQRRDINDVPEPDKAIPQGFRGYQPS